jgi:hypothetical protein
MATPQQQVDPYQAVSRKSGVLLAVGLVALALMAGFAIGRGGLFGRFGEVAGPGQSAVLDVPGQKGDVPIQAADPGLDIPLELGFDPQRPDLSLGAQPAGPTTQVGDKMPQEVRDWLLHLERTERERHRMTKAQMGQAMGLLLGSTASQYKELIGEAYGEESDEQDSHLRNPELHASFTKAAPAMRKGWKDIVSYFNSKQPPAECIPIKNAYEQCLGETGTMMLDVISALEGTGSEDADLGAAADKLMGMMGTSSERIDTLGEQTDRLVGRVCDKYETYKWFSISGDIGGGLGGLGLGGLGGLLGGG